MSNATFADAATHARLRMDPTYSTVLYAPSSAAVTYAVQMPDLRTTAEPVGDPSDEDYTWTEQAAPAGLPAARATTDPVKRELVAMGNAISDLQRDVQHLSELVHRLLNVGEEPDAEDTRA